MNAEDPSNAIDETRRRALFEDATHRLMAIADNMKAGLEPCDIAGTFLATALKIYIAELGVAGAAAQLRRTGFELLTELGATDRELTVYRDDLND